MRKPNNYDNTKASGEFTPAEPGGHKMVIKDVTVSQTKTGKEMLIVRFDFATNDIQPGFFAKQFRDDIRPDKKWPYDGTQWIVTEDNEGNCTRSLKTFITSVEKSNPGLEIPWDSDDAVFERAFKGKLIGGVFGVVMDYYNGKDVERRQLRWFRSIDSVMDVTPPTPSETQAYKDAHKAETPEGFMEVPDTAIDEEIPFN